MQRINLILEAGNASFGDKFEDMMNHALVRLRGAPLRRIQAVHIRPSEDIGALAADFVSSGRMRVQRPGRAPADPAARGRRGGATRATSCRTCCSTAGSRRS